MLIPGEEGYVGSFLIHQNGENNDVCDFLRVEGNQQASLSPVMLLIFNVFFVVVFFKSK